MKKEKFFDKATFTVIIFMSILTLIGVLWLLNLDPKIKGSSTINVNKTEADSCVERLVEKDTLVGLNIPIKVTVYEPCEEQCDESPDRTADGSYIVSGSYYYWCAVSRDLMFYYVNFGDVLVVQGSDGILREFEVRDNMGEQATKQIDILIPLGSYSTREYKDHLGDVFSECKIVQIKRQ